MKQNKKNCATRNGSGKKRDGGFLIKIVVYLSLILIYVAGYSSLFALFCLLRRGTTIGKKSKSVYHTRRFVTSHEGALQKRREECLLEKSFSSTLSSTVSRSSGEARLCHSFVSTFAFHHSPSSTRCEGFEGNLRELIFSAYDIQLCLCRFRRFNYSSSDLSYSLAS